MNLIEFKDLPDTSTPLNAENLNNNFNEIKTNLADLVEKEDELKTQTTFFEELSVEEDGSRNVQLYDYEKNKLNINNNNSNINNAITLKKTTSQSISGTNLQEITFSDAVTVGEKLTLSENKVLVNDGVSKVKVSAQMYISTGVSSGDRINFDIYINYGKDTQRQITTNQLIFNSALSSISSSEILVDVSPGDLIGIYARNRTSGAGNIYSIGTNLTVEVME